MGSEDGNVRVKVTKRQILGKSKCGDEITHLRRKRWLRFASRSRTERTLAAMGCARGTPRNGRRLEDREERSGTRAGQSHVHEVLPGRRDEMKPVNTTPEHSSQEPKARTTELPQKEMCKGKQRKNKVMGTEVAPIHRGVNPQTQTIPDNLGLITSSSATRGAPSVENVKRWDSAERPLGCRGLMRAAVMAHIQQRKDDAPGTTRSMERKEGKERIGSNSA
ncbi:hypothetical protein B0H17DRAFT_1137007 [Mycena rosella]|uniref:Uncharacterized protein n=1 Tax=Mycena rosella TaxID=1033263 RepID=A0AAD7DCV3_MYCRO|nr:hypothetical protein B0H17DRAFT_1137007 [Mycena rosella]